MGGLFSQKNIVIVWNNDMNDVKFKLKSEITIGIKAMMYPKNKQSLVGQVENTSDHADVG